MAYKKHPPKSRRYKKNSSSSHHTQDEAIQKIAPVEPEAKPVEIVSREKVTSEKKNSNPLGFLSSLLGTGTGERAERTGNPVFHILDHDIYFDDLLLVGLIILLLTEKNSDEVLLIILAYLLIDIF